MFDWRGPWHGRGDGRRERHARLVLRRRPLPRPRRGRRPRPRAGRRRAPTVLDVGGESTRPGAEPVAADEELRRVAPGRRGAGRRRRACRSASTPRKAAVAAAALAAGATIVNDVSAGRRSRDARRRRRRRRRATSRCTCRASPRTMQDDPHYDDVVAEVGDFLVERLDAARAAGIADEVADAPTPASASARPSRTTSTLLARLGDAGRPRRRAGAGRHRPARRSSARLLGVDDPRRARDDGTLATAVWALDQRRRDGAGARRRGRGRRAAALLDVLDGAPRR